MTQQSFEFLKIEYKIKTWSELDTLPSKFHDAEFLNILNKHGFNDLILPIPLKTRYTKGRKWTIEEFTVCFEAWLNGVSLTLISANLNRNPQDIIYKLLDECKQREIQFTQKGRSESSKKWSIDVAKCALELFGYGLPAWKIAVIFQVEFEFVEKKVFKDREGYGHKKKNPFSINTDHKQLINIKILENIIYDGFRVLEPFAGEGRFTKILLQKSQLSSVICIEENKLTFEKLSQIDDPRCEKIFQDNISVLRTIKKKFDLIDLDPFATCHKQIELIWKNLKDCSYLFLTFGGEYRRSFIASNRKSMLERYEFDDMTCSNSDYLEAVPYYFLGNVAKRSSSNGFKFSVLKAVRYANYCRFWLCLEKIDNPKKWYNEVVTENDKGQKFLNLVIPRFKEIRHEIDNAKKQGFKS